jgi:D-alanyl-D-alanine carboxypeptidase
VVTEDRSSKGEPTMSRKLAVLVAAALALTACTTTTDTGTPQRLGATTRPTDAVQKALDGLVADDHLPGALAAVRGRDGRTRDYTAGVGDLRTSEPMPVNGRLRIASNTKMFTATVVLQLVGEGRIGLDEPVETYLPGIVRGQGVDGRQITVRQLLQHTSGIGDYDDVLIQDYFSVRHTYFEPRQLVDAALTKPAAFPPGRGWTYSNTNYVLAGLIVQKVTGRPVGEEITRRVVDRLELRDTYWPADQTIAGPHPHGYWPDADGELVDVTEMDPSMGWAAGQLVGTPRDLNTFLTELLDGELLAPAQLREMTTLVDAPDFALSGTGRYGLGIGTVELSCGGVALTHGGDAPGYHSRNAVAEDGRAATVVVTAPPTERVAAERLDKALDTAICAR